MESAIRNQEFDSRSEKESDRLRQQHELVKVVMGGKLVRSPVELGRPGLRVLDSGTAQALWPLDLLTTGELHETAVVVGTDIAPQHFPPPEARPPRLSLQLQSVLEQWPAHHLAAYDLVHQRFVLAVCASPGQAAEAVSSLFACVRPGGWIELHEGNMATIREGPSHRAMMRFRDVALKAWSQILNQLPAPGSSIAGWLREAGAVDVQEETQVLRLGAEAASAEEAGQSMVVIAGMLAGIRAICAGKAGFPSAAEFDELEADLVREIREVGNFWQYHLAFGRKPEN